LDDRSENPDHYCRRNDGQAVDGEHLSHEYGERRKQHGREHEAVPGELQADPACLEALEIVLGWSAEDVWVVEESPQQQEERRGR
jgi:hypothetical protein